MATRIGILAEERSDVEVAESLIQKIIPRKSFSIHSFVGHGCGKLRSKCRDWAQQLALRRCSALILIHDLDERRLSDLRHDLDKALNPCPVEAHMIVIPIKEIEAWLLCDGRAIKEAFGLSRIPSVPGQPEQVLRPKEKLRDLVWHCSERRTRYINSVHNRRIADALPIHSLAKCSAFTAFRRFVEGELAIQAVG
jgi:hypothetical protein